MQRPGERPRKCLRWLQQAIESIVKSDGDRVDGDRVDGDRVDGDDENDDGCGDRMTSIRKWLEEQWFPFVDESVIKTIYHQVDGSQHGMGGSEEKRMKDDGYGVGDVLGFLDGSAKNTIMRVVQVLRGMDEENREKGVAIMEEMMFGDHGQSAGILERLVDEDVNNEEDVGVWKRRVETLEEHIADLQMELREVKAASDKKFKEVTANFDFWAKLVLGELHTLGAADAGARKEFDERIRVLEEANVGKSGSGNGNGRKRVRGKKSRKMTSNVSDDMNKESGEDWDDEEAKTAAQAVQATIVDTERPMERGDGLVEVGVNGYIGEDDVDEGEDHELMKAFRNALGPNFAINPMPKGARIFRDGEWIDLKSREV